MAGVIEHARSFGVGALIKKFVQESTNFIAVSLLKIMSLAIR
jgi:hypothetical protein